MTDYQITLSTRDGQTLQFSAEEDQDIVSAAQSAGFDLPSVCRNGDCGACLATCQTGQYQLGHCSESMLPPEQIAKQQVFLCRTFAQSDLSIVAPYDYAHIHQGDMNAQPAVITRLESVAQRTMRLTLQLTGTDKAVEFEPGQYVELETSTGIRRAYSLANTPNWQGELDFFIRLQAQGKFSTFLSEQAALGQTLKVYAPKGVFAFQSQSMASAIFVAGGTGLAPFLSMLGQMVQFGEHPAVQLFFGVNDESELFCLEQLNYLQSQLPSLNVTYCVWHPSSQWQGFHGIPVDALESFLKNQPQAYDLYLCGPPRLIEGCRRVALAHGVDEAHFFVETFG